jgi:hypothetical protein
MLPAVIDLRSGTWRVGRSATAGEVNSQRRRRVAWLPTPLTARTRRLDERERKEKSGSKLVLVKLSERLPTRELNKSSGELYAGVQPPVKVSATCSGAGPAWITPDDIYEFRPRLGSGAGCQARRAKSCGAWVGPRWRDRARKRGVCRTDLLKRVQRIHGGSGCCAGASAPQGARRGRIILGPDATGAPTAQARA